MKIKEDIKFLSINIGLIALFMFCMKILIIK